MTGEVCPGGRRATMEKVVWELVCEGCRKVQVVECPVGDEFEALQYYSFQVCPVTCVGRGLPCGVLVRLQRGGWVDKGGCPKRMVTDGR